MKWIKILLIITIGLLFIFNSDICNIYYDSDIQTKEWWNLRHKFYSLIFVLLGIFGFANADRGLRVIMIPLIAILLGDLKDRVIFDFAERHWSDIFLILLSVYLMVSIWLKNAKSSK